jgi:hypothetical protein
MHSRCVRAPIWRYGTDVNFTRNVIGGVCYELIFRPMTPSYSTPSRTDSIQNP